MCRVSVIVPVYQVEAYLPGCLDSILAQTFEDFELILVDDGSKDKTWELICRFCEENPLCAGLKLAHNRGHQNALLAGLMAAKVLKGEVKASDMAYEVISDPSLYVNAEALARFGITLSDDLSARAIEAE